MSLRRLYEETRELLVHDPSLMTQFDAAFYEAIGSGWNSAMEEAFDWELAEKSLAYFTAESIPKIEGNISGAVSDVRFRSNLSSIIPIEDELLLAFAGLLAAARKVGK